ncbi:MAG: hypothetical protein ACXVZX_04030 [Terriglobales bacterium]
MTSESAVLHEHEPVTMADSPEDGLRTSIRLLLFVSLAAVFSFAQTSDTDKLARDIFQELVDMNTTESGVGSTPAAQALAERFRRGGFSGDDLFVGGKVPRKQNVVVRLRGRGNAKPILLIAHLDVVEANKQDWSPDLDPFKLTEKTATSTAAAPRT